MKYLLDTANLAEIRRFYDIFPIAGVTSNPSIVKREGNIDFFDHMKEIRSIIGIDKPLHIQVTASDTDGMLRDADTLLNKVDSEVYVKIPVTMEGIKTIKLLKAQNIHVTGTAIYSKQQGFLAMEAGADFVKTSTGFLTGFESNGATPEIIKVMMEEVGDQCKVKGSGCIRTREHFLQLIDMGIDRMGVGYRSVPVVLNLEK